MIYDHMMYFGDKKLVEKYMPTVERILLFFEDYLSEKGYLERIQEEIKNVKLELLECKHCVDAIAAQCFLL